MIFFIVTCNVFVKLLQCTKNYFFLADLGLISLEF